MNPEKQLIAIAEACGWENIKHVATLDGRPILVGDVPNIVQDITKEIPNYLHDLNAMHEAEKTLSIEQKQDFYQEHIHDVVTRGRSPRPRSWSPGSGSGR